MSDQKLCSTCGNVLDSNNKVVFGLYQQSCHVCIKKWIKEDAYTEKRKAFDAEKKIKSITIKEFFKELDDAIRESNLDTGIFYFCKHSKEMKSLSEKNEKDELFFFC